eukprot:scaffold347_cov239-Pinguiococcus_pyrenoidosus.AAC.16
MLLLAALMLALGDLESLLGLLRAVHLAPQVADLRPARCDDVCLLLPFNVHAPHEIRSLLLLARQVSFQILDLPLRPQLDLRVLLKLSLRPTQLLQLLLLGLQPDKKRLALLLHRLGWLRIALLEPLKLVQQVLPIGENRLDLLVRLAQLGFVEGLHLGVLAHLALEVHEHFLLKVDGLRELLDCKAHSLLTLLKILRLEIRGGQGLLRFLDCRFHTRIGNALGVARPSATYLEIPRALHVLKLALKFLDSLVQGLGACDEARLLLHCCRDGDRFGRRVGLLVLVLQDCPCLFWAGVRPLRAVEIPFRAQKAHAVAQILRVLRHGLKLYLKTLYLGVLRSQVAEGRPAPRSPLEALRRSPFRGGAVLRIRAGSRRHRSYRVAGRKRRSAAARIGVLRELHWIPGFGGQLCQLSFTEFVQRLHLAHERFYGVLLLVFLAPALDLPAQEHLLRQSSNELAHLDDHRVLRIPVDYRAILNVARPVGVSERVEGLGHVRVRRRNTADHHGLAVSAERVLQHSCQLRIAVRNVHTAPLLLVPKGADDIAKGQ